MRGLSDEYIEYNGSAAKLDATTIEYLRNMPVMKLFRQDSSSFQVMCRQLQHYYQLVISLTRKTVTEWSLFSRLLGANILVILPLGIWL